MEFKIVNFTVMFVAKEPHNCIFNLTIQSAAGKETKNPRIHEMTYFWRRIFVIY